MCVCLIPTYFLPGLGVDIPYNLSLGYNLHEMSHQNLKWKIRKKKYEFAVYQFDLAIAGALC